MLPPKVFSGFEPATTKQTSGCLISCAYDCPSGEEAIGIVLAKDFDITYSEAK